jgi:hypothetical protein
MRPEEDQARPAITRGLLRVSKTFGRDASTSAQEGAWQRAERAVSRTTGRLGHWTDPRNTEGETGLSGGKGRGWALLALVGIAVTGIVLALRRSSAR